MALYKNFPNFAHTIFDQTIRWFLGVRSQLSEYYL